MAELALKYTLVHGVPIRFIADQIAGRAKAKDKLPSFYQRNSIIYPPGVNLEQSSSEITARFKIKLLAEMLHQRKSCADLTGGFGVDSFFLSRIFDRVSYVESNPELINIAAHNHHELGATGIGHYHTLAHDFLSSSDTQFDCLYIDPSRRDRNNKKVFSFSECEPDVSVLLPEMFKRSAHVLIKASPLLDLDKAVRDIRGVTRIFIIAVANECKELLFWCAGHAIGEYSIDAINIKKDGSIDTFKFSPTEERVSTPEFSDPLTYIYEPNAAILKAGAFKTVGRRFDLFKLHPSTHLYTSKELKSDFPGRVFKIIQHVKATQKNELNSFFPSGQANVTTRNYPMTVQELRHKTGLRDGGTDFLIGFSGIQKKFLVVAERQH